MAKRAQPVWDETRHTYVMPDGRTLAEATQGGATTAPAAVLPHKRRRVFMWFFLAVQALFLVWLVVGLATAHPGPTTAQVAQFCGNGQWQGVFTSYHDCVVHGANGLRAAGEIGTGIGAALIIGLWVAVDVILGIGRLVVVLARRH